MPNRIVRESINSSQSVGSLSLGANLFYRMLLLVVDDYGLFEAEPAILRTRLYPWALDKVREADITRWLNECERAKPASLIRLYAVDGRRYLYVFKVEPPRAAKARFPLPPGMELRTKQGLFAISARNGQQRLANVSNSDSNSSSNANSKPPTPVPGASEEEEKPPGNRKRVKPPSTRHALAIAMAIDPDTAQGRDADYLAWATSFADAHGWRSNEGAIAMIAGWRSQFAQTPIDRLHEAARRIAGSSAKYLSGYLPMLLAALRAVESDQQKRGQPTSKRGEPTDEDCARIRKQLDNAGKVSQKRKMARS